MNLLPRHLQAQVAERLAQFPAVVLLGPRQVGKTTLARTLAEGWPGGAVYLDLERPADRRRLEDADAYLRAQRGKLVVLDEIHRAPGLFEVLRGVIDERRMAGERHGHFLLLGSAALDLMRQASESLAGRITTLEMGPLALDEAAAGQLGEEPLWIRGGFPDSLLAPDDDKSLIWRRDFIRTYLERDVPMFAPRLPNATLGRLWTMLAHQQGGLLNQARLASALGISAPAVGRYVDLLVDLQLVRRLAPWSGNVGKRLTRTPKVYIRDSGIVHALLELRGLDDVLGHPVAGASYEGMVIENLLGVSGPGRSAYFYRTQDGAEIDLVFSRGGRPEMAVEIKRSTAPSPGRGFSQACDALGIEDRWVVYPGSESFPLRHGTQATPLLDLIARLQATL